MSRKKRKFKLGGQQEAFAVSLKRSLNNVGSIEWTTYGTVKLNKTKAYVCESGLSWVSSKFWTVRFTNGQKKVFRGCTKKKEKSRIVSIVKLFESQNWV